MVKISTINDDGIKYDHETGRNHDNPDSAFNGNLVIVPGNYDLNWKLSQKEYFLIDLEDYKGELREGSHIDVGGGFSYG